MTSLAETYLSCKTAFANKLVSKGVSASSDDGLTTLIGKIDDIGDSFDTGILLSADKSVEQKGTTQSPNTINLSALVLENGNFKPGATVLLYESILDKTYTAGETLNLSIGSDWEIDLGTGANIWLCANGATIAGGDYILSLAGNYLIGYGGGGYVISPRELPGNGKLRLKDGVLYFGNSSLDLSSYNFTLTNLNKVTEAGSVKVFTPTSLTTNSNGIATKSYTCSGVGKKEFYATCGTLVSEPYTVWDCLYYDEASENTHKTYTGTLSPSYDIDSTILAETSNTTKTFIFNYSAIDDVKIEFDAKITVASPTQMRLLYFGADYWFASYFNDLDYHHFEFTVSNGNMTCKVDNVSKDTISTSSGSTVMFALKNATMHFKNLKIYPI